MRLNREDKQNLLVTLIGLLTIDIVLLLALFAQVDPHPPGFLGPFIGAMITLGIISVMLTFWERRIGLVAALIYGCANVLAVGPQKFFFDPNGQEVVPVVVLGTILIGALFYSVLQVWREGEQPSSIGLGVA
jgi:hypothetical protein